MIWKMILARFIKNKGVMGELDIERLAEDLSLDYFRSFLNDAITRSDAGTLFNECNDSE